MFFVSERDVHLGSLRAAMLPEMPPVARRQALGLQGRPIAVPAGIRHVILPEVLAAHG
jgi:hypothetical protein